MGIERTEKMLPKSVDISLLAEDGPFFSNSAPILIIKFGTLEERDIATVLAAVVADVIGKLRHEAAKTCR